MVKIALLKSSEPNKHFEYERDDVLEPGYRWRTLSGPMTDVPHPNVSYFLEGKYHIVLDSDWAMPINNLHKCVLSSIISELEDRHRAAPIDIGHDTGFVEWGGNLERNIKLGHWIDFFKTYK